MTKLVAIKTDGDVIQWVNPDQVQRVQPHNQKPERAVIHFANGSTLVSSDTPEAVAATLSTQTGMQHQCNTAPPKLG